MDDLTYLREGIRRLESGEVQAGSHAAGIFGRCAAAFEGKIRSWFSQLLRSCALDYDRDIKGSCKGAQLEKTTLGNIIAGLKHAEALKPGCVTSRAPSLGDPFLEILRGINTDWVRMKHHEEISVSTILDRMRSMEMIEADLASESSRYRDVSDSEKN